MDVMGIVIALLIGAVVGWLAGLVMGGRGGLLRNIILGIIGSVVGTFLLGLIGIHGYGLIANILVAAFGACVLIGVGRVLLR